MYMAYLKCRVSGESMTLYMTLTNQLLSKVSISSFRLYKFHIMIWKCFLQIKSYNGRTELVIIDKASPMYICFYIAPEATKK